jgi:predicted cytidylate kinase
MIITLGGEPASGKSSVGRVLAARLGLPFFSMGDIRRAYAHEHGITLEELNRRAQTDPTSDKLVDEKQATLDEEYPRGFVLDSRLGFLYLPQSLKIFLTVDARVAAERLVASERAGERAETVDEALASLSRRMREDRERYVQLYDVDYLDRSQYDLVIDTTGKTVEEIVGQVFDVIKQEGY